MIEFKKEDTFILQATWADNALNYYSKNPEMVANQWPELKDVPPQRLIFQAYRARALRADLYQSLIEAGTPPLVELPEKEVVKV